jgi:8-oxo-dGTP pyrophosphatase MutT (NUDIX family)
MRQVKACGVLVVKGNPIESFLLMKHARRLDLPKGHLEAGESDIDCALRELQEETGIAADDVELDPSFRFAVDYYVRYRDFNNELAHKTVAYFLARLKRDVPIVLTEHKGYAWYPWQPPHKIQRETVDPLLAAVEQHVASRTNDASP